MNRLAETVSFLAPRLPGPPGVGLVLGSGLGALADRLEDALEIPYVEIPHFPVSRVAGHAGALVCGKLAGHGVAILSGRVHFYEGHPLADVVHPVRTLGRLGVKTLLVTNAAGGISAHLAPGDLMAITDHINMLGDNPLRGDNDETLGPRFPDLSEAYSRRLVGLLDKAAAAAGVELKKGIYLAAAGPSYETPAEIRMMAGLGADAVGMSTVPEVIAARHMGIEVAGLSCITNHAAGISPVPLSHEEVTATGGRGREKLISLVRAFVAEVAGNR